jgi:hypothetical protein
MSGAMMALMANNHVTSQLTSGSTDPGYMRSVVYSTVTSSFLAVGFDNTGPNWLYAVTT